MSQIPHRSVRPSACPSLTRIVAARDGGLCRLRLSGGRLSADQADTIAAAATRHAAGVIDVTNRANLQVRGVRAGHEAALIDALARNLDPQDGPDLMMSPAAGRDPHARVDARPLAAQIMQRVQAESRFAALSPKFSVLLDGGERLAKLDHPHDIWLSLLNGEPANTQDAAFVCGLAGGPLVDSSTSARIVIDYADVPQLVDALLHVFLDLASDDDTRMRDLLISHTAQAIFDRAAARAACAMRLAPSTWQRGTADPLLRFGAQAQRASHPDAPSLWQYGAQPTLGRLDAHTLHALADLARAHGGDSLTVTPWQGVMLHDLRETQLDAVAHAFASLGFATHATDPLARVIACTGSTGCTRSHADTKADARALAARLRDAPTLSTHDVHLSGCARSCAAAHRACYTLLAVAPGLYDVYQRDRARAAPTGPESESESDPQGRHFGTRIATNLSIDAAASLLSSHSCSASAPASITSNPPIADAPRSVRHD